jgi:hypothetical protein
MRSEACRVVAADSRLTRCSVYAGQRSLVRGRGRIRGMGRARDRVRAKDRI